MLDLCVWLFIFKCLVHFFARELKKADYVEKHHLSAENLKTANELDHCDQIHKHRTRITFILLEIELELLAG